MDLTQSKLRHIGILLNHSHRKTFYENHWMQGRYILTDSYTSLGLTQRQSECLFYLIRGKSCNEVSNILSRSRRTIEHHVDIIKDKLGCKNRSEIISKIYDLQLDTTIPTSILQHPLDEIL